MAIYQRRGYNMKKLQFLFPGKVKNGRTLVIDIVVTGGACKQMVQVSTRQYTRCSILSRIREWFNSCLKGTDEEASK